MYARLRPIVVVRYENNHWSRAGVLKTFDTATPFLDLVFQPPPIFKYKQKKEKPLMAKFYP